jgi:hypothetical protein
MAESADGAAEARRPGRRRALWRSAEPHRPTEPGTEIPSAGQGRLGNLWVGIQRGLGFGVMRVSGPLRKVHGGAEPPQVRARLERARIKEQYFYFQEISQNAVRYMDEAPQGRIELVLPYDGDRYFSRQARSDMEHARRPGADAATEALIGHLVLTDFEHANLSSLLDQEPMRGSVPIRVPTAGLPGPGEPDPLVADSSACVVSHEYVPDTRQFKVDPVDVDAQLHDPDDAELHYPGTAQFSLSSEDDFSSERLRIMRHVGFLPELRLHMTVRLAIPRVLAAGGRARVRQVFIRWPTHTSLRSLDLLVDGQPRRLRYNPEREGLEWSDIDMAMEADSGDGEICTFRSPAMDLVIPQPGELYQQPSLDGKVQVTVNRLLSGMDARVYDATGTQDGHPRVARESLIFTRFSLILGDAFARRTLSPHQQLHFDEVIPAETRIDDIKMALKNLGFKVADPWPEHGPERRWLSAERAEGRTSSSSRSTWRASNISRGASGAFLAVLPTAPTWTVASCGFTPMAG